MKIRRIRTCPVQARQRFAAGIGVARDLQLDAQVRGIRQPVQQIGGHKPAFERGDQKGAVSETLLNHFVENFGFVPAIGLEQGLNCSTGFFNRFGQGVLLGITALIASSAV